MDLRVPVTAKAVTISFVDGLQKKGTVYIPDAAPDHSGRMRIEEWLNLKEMFFPFKADDSATPVIINKNNVVTVSTDYEVDDQEFAVLNQILKCRVKVEMHNVEITGSLIIDMPENRLRVLDVLNYDHHFLTLVEDEFEILINKRLIFQVIELH